MPLELPHSVWLKSTPRGVARRTDNILDTNNSCNRRRRNSKPAARSSMVGIILGLHEPLFIGCPAALGLSDPLLLDKPRGRSANEIRWRAFCRFADNWWGCGSRHCRGSPVTLFNAQTPTSYLPALGGACAGILPDALQFAYMRFPHQPLTSIQQFHEWIHTTRRMPKQPGLGIISQVALVTAFTVAVQPLLAAQ